jgi:hypothetical protein
MEAEGSAGQHSSRALELSFLRSLQEELEGILEVLDVSAPEPPPRRATPGAPLQGEIDLA